jgi:hypothetical protein
MNGNRYAKDEQAFVRALQEAVNNNDECEAARLVSEHTEAFEAFLERMLMQLEHIPNSTLH